jgi:16S rRNA G966 N2-methylase RsmD
MNRALLHIDVQNFIKANLNADIPALSLKKSPFSNISSRELVEQLDSKKRSEHKLPLWFQTEGIYYPPKLAIEQSSSELAAIYKSNLLTGNDIIDLTGGFGVDTYFFARKVKNVTHCELNNELSELSHYNSKILGVKINYLQVDGIEYLKRHNKTFDTVYIDPSRRVNSKKVFLLKDCEPDIILNLELLKNRSELLMVKTAPLLDIQSTINELKEVSSVHIVSIKNECKELLYLINNQSCSSDPMINCVLIGTDQTITYSFRPSEERNFMLSEYSDPKDFIYLPDVALLKAGCFKLITRDFRVHKIHQHTHLYTSERFIDSFPGRKFIMQNSWSYGKFLKESGFKKANIICRNFPISPEDLKKKLKIIDGGDEYLIFCTNKTNELIVLSCILHKG